MNRSMRASLIRWFEMVDRRERARRPRRLTLGGLDALEGRAIPSTFGGFETPTSGQAPVERMEVTYTDTTDDQDDGDQGSDSDHTKLPDPTGDTLEPPDSVLF